MNLSEPSATGFRFPRWPAIALCALLLAGCGKAREERGAPGPGAVAQRAAPQDASAGDGWKRERRRPTAEQREIKRFVSRLEVAQGVLRPPASTLRVIMPYMRAHADSIRGKRVLDIGCGTGVIALWAAELGAASVIATDIDPIAIENTRRNIERLGRKGIVEARLVPTDRPEAFSVMRPEERFDLIVSNPPWFIDVDGDNDAYTETGVLGPSIIRGLKGRLADGGIAALIYRDPFYPTFLARLAESEGLEVSQHLPDRVHPIQLATLYNAYLPRMFERMGIPESERARFRMQASDPWADVTITVRPKRGRERDPFPGLLEIRTR